MTEPLDALDGEIARITALLDGLTGEDWERETRCPPMNVRVMAGHLLNQAARLLELLTLPAAPTPPEHTAVSYYRYDPATAAPGVLQRAEAMAKERAGPQMTQDWKTYWPSALATARNRWADDPVLQSPFGTIHLSEYVRTRCLEATVHHMDLLDALGRDPDPDPRALAVTVAVLEGLLGAPMGETGMRPVEFALAGTGRRPLTTDEHERLGPLADNFPLLS